ncbi:MAG: hypothetical protein MPL62_13935 [Alphaproteobacteria bacterium]|nr:hypothetical protein [Alphaproteobacteria bacterium]
MRGGPARRLRRRLGADGDLANFITIAHARDRFADFGSCAPVFPARSAARRQSPEFH